MSYMNLKKIFIVVSLSLIPWVTFAEDSPAKDPSLGPFQRVLAAAGFSETPAKPDSKQQTSNKPSTQADNKAQPPAPPAKPVEVEYEYIDDVKDTELKDLFQGFDVAESGEDPNLQISLQGGIFDECKDGVTINVTTAYEKAIAFEITDPAGNGRKCVKNLRAKGAVCGAKHACTKISDLGGQSVIDLKDQKSARVGLVYKDPNYFKRDDQLIFADLPGLGEFHHLDSIDWFAKQEDEKRERKQAKIDHLKYEIAHCTNTPDNLEIRNDAIDSLLAIDQTFTQQDADNEYAKSDEFKLEILETNVGSCKDDFTNLRHQLESYATQLNANASISRDTYKERITRVARNLYHLAAKCVHPDKKEDPDAKVTKEIYDQEKADFEAIRRVIKNSKKFSTSEKNQLIKEFQLDKTEARAASEYILDSDVPNGSAEMGNMELGADLQNLAGPAFGNYIDQACGSSNAMMGMMGGFYMSGGFTSQSNMMNSYMACAQAYKDFQSFQTQTSIASQMADRAQIMKAQMMMRSGMNPGAFAGANQGSAAAYLGGGFDFSNAGRNPFDP